MTGQRTPDALQNATSVLPSDEERARAWLLSPAGYRPDTINMDMLRALAELLTEVRSDASLSLLLKLEHQREHEEWVRKLFLHDLMGKDKGMRTLNAKLRTVRQDERRRCALELEAAGRSSPNNRDAIYARRGADLLREPLVRIGSRPSSGLAPVKP